MLLLSTSLIYKASSMPICKTHKRVKKLTIFNSVYSEFLEYKENEELVQSNERYLYQQKKDQSIIMDCIPIFRTKISLIHIFEPFHTYLIC